jgi:hypothetical protein
MSSSAVVQINETLLFGGIITMADSLAMHI